MGDATRFPTSPAGGHYNYDTGVCEAEPAVSTPASQPTSTSTSTSTSTPTSTSTSSASTSAPVDTLETTSSTPAVNTTSDRTRARAPAPYADAGVSTSGNTVHAGVAAIRGRDPNSGVETEIFYAEVSAGGSTGGRIGMGRVGGSSDDGVHSVGMDVFTAEANIGFENPDGSTGLHAGAMATAVGIEGTTGYSGNSITGGLSASVGAGGSIGVRDQDGDGSLELCARVSVMFFTLGACIENPF